jgi:LysM repeat protein
MNANLVDMIKGELPGEFLNSASLLLGESKDTTRLGINAAIPGILGGFASAASTSDGATRLASAVDDADEATLSGAGSMFGRITDRGSGAVRSILGAGGLAELTGSVGRTSGLSGKSVTTLLGLLAPIVLSFLKRVKRSRGLDSTGFAVFLSDQRENIVSAMPERMATGEYANVRTGLRDTNDENYSAGRAGRFRETEPHTTGHGTRSWDWLVPVALLALFAGLIWHWSRGAAVRAGGERKVGEESARPSPKSYGRMPMASLETLKTKYSSAIEKARAEGVQISSITQSGGKLAIRGTAPSLEAADRLKQEFRRIDPEMNDVVVNLGVDPSMAALPQSSAQPEKKESSGGFNDSFTRAKPTTRPAAPSTETPSTDMQTYTVKPGDTLGKISNQFYGTTKGYMRIYNQNKSTLKDANALRVGQKLEIPAK